MTEASTDSHGQPHRIGRGRRIGVVVLSVLSVLFLATGSIGYWAARTALDNDVFVTRVGPLASDPAVQTALADWLTQEVLTLVDVEGYLKQSLPPPADLLAKPLSAAVEDFVNKAVRDVLASDQFAELWQRVTGDAHRAFVVAASGNDSNVSTDDQGRVVVNLIPVIGEVFESLTGASPDLVSRVTGTLENLASDPPAQAIEALENATGITLPKDFGVVVIDDGGTLETVRTIVEATRVAVVALIVGFVACTAAAVALARPRRRTGVQLLGAFAVTLAFVRQLAILVDERLTAEVRVPANQRKPVLCGRAAVKSGLVRRRIWRASMPRTMAPMTGLKAASGMRRRMAQPARMPMKMGHARRRMWCQRICWRKRAAARMSAKMRRGRTAPLEALPGMIWAMRTTVIMPTPARPDFPMPQENPARMRRDHWASE